MVPVPTGKLNNIVDDEALCVKTITDTGMPSMDVRDPPSSFELPVAVTKGERRVSSPNEDTYFKTGFYGENQSQISFASPSEAVTIGEGHMLSPCQDTNPKRRFYQENLSQISFAPPSEIGSESINPSTVGLEFNKRNMTLGWNRHEDAGVSLRNHVNTVTGSDLCSIYDDSEILSEENNELIWDSDSCNESLGGVSV